MIKIKELRTDRLINIPLKGNEILGQVLSAVNSHKEIKTLWNIVNINATERYGMTDHGIVHVRIVSNISVKIVRMLVSAKVVMSVTKNYDLPDKYAEVIVFLASAFHDLGMSIEREGHEDLSIILANNILHEVLQFLPSVERTIICSETLHAMICHRSGGHPQTIEAGIVRVADALDMSKGRSRIPYKSGNADIHSVSAAAIENVRIVKGNDKPIQLNIAMNNSAGIFQLDELLKNKLLGSGIEKYISVRAFISQQKEKKLIKEYIINTSKMI